MTFPLFFETYEHSSSVVLYFQTLAVITDERMTFYKHRRSNAPPEKERKHGIQFYQMVWMPIATPMQQT